VRNRQESKTGNGQKGREREKEKKKVIVLPIFSAVLIWISQGSSRKMRLWFSALTPTLDL